MPTCVPFAFRRYQVEREIRIHILMDHVNVVRLHVAFEDEKNVYMVQVGLQVPATACICGVKRLTRRR